MAYPPPRADGSTSIRRAMIPDMNARKKRDSNLVGSSVRSVKPTLRHLFKSGIRHTDIKGPRELELIRLAQAGDRKAQQVLDQAHLPLVYLTVSRYFGHGVDEADLVQEGRLGLQHAVRKFDESRNVALCTYAVRWIRNYAAMHLSMNCADIRVPVKVREAYGRMLRSHASHDDLANSPKPADRVLLKNLDTVSPAVRLDEPYLRRGTHEEYKSAHDITPSDDLPPDEALDSARTNLIRENLLSRLVAKLPPREFEVVSRRYPLDDSQSQETQVEIAKSFGRLLGKGCSKLTRQRVQQIERRALGRLASRLGVLDLDLDLDGSTSIRRGMVRTCATSTRRT